MKTHRCSENFARGKMQESPKVTPSHSKKVKQEGFENYKTRVVKLTREMTIMYSNAATDPKIADTIAQDALKMIESLQKSLEELRIKSEEDLKKREILKEFTTPPKLELKATRTGTSSRNPYENDSCVILPRKTNLPRFGRTRATYLLKLDEDVKP